MTMKQPFEKVVAEHGVTVLRVCRAVLGPHADADDAWSETFLAALRAYPDLPVDANVEAWLVTIAHRKAIDVTRARRRNAVPVAEPPEGGTSGGDPAEREPDLWRAVAALPDKQRMSVAYHYLGGLPYAQVADLLGGTADAARRAAADGIKRLRAVPGLSPALPREGATR
jgi:RNA polymerase sigma factor (sigma-70 family)